MKKRPFNRVNNIYESINQINTILFSLVIKISTYEIGVMHKPRGQFFRLFWPPSWTVLLYGLFFSKVDISQNPSSMTVHVVWVWPLISTYCVNVNIFIWLILHPSSNSWYQTYLECYESNQSNNKTFKKMKIETF